MTSGVFAYVPGTYCRPVEKPTAPSAIARQTSDRIFASSGMVGRRLSEPMMALRTVLWPINVAKLIAVPVRVMLASASPTSSAELPQLPATIVVTPMRTKFSASGWPSRSSACVCTSMKPGATIRPAASMTSRASCTAMVPMTAM